MVLIQKYGYWALLLSWAPLIGDILCLLAGWMKLPLLRSTLMILVGKCVRYLLVAAFALHWL
jgi:membrane protein YqaA with SNARE-associated domain